MHQARAILEEEGSTAPADHHRADPGPSHLKERMLPEPPVAGPSHCDWTANAGLSSSPPPWAAPSSSSAADLAFLRRDFPAISHWPDEMLRAHPIGELARAHAELETKLGRGGRPSLESQLDNNYQKLGTTTTTVTAGPDNQLDQLHPARFLPGALATTTDLWLKARDNLPKDGLVPYGQYDAHNLGLGRNISSKAWAALHNPGSLNLSIKLFQPSSCFTRNSDAKRDGDNFDSLEDFKTALRAAGTAQQLVTPWNFSVAAIEGFLHTTSFGYKFFKSQKEHVTQLTAFVDSCFTENGRRWTLRRPFLTISDLTNEWNVFTSTKSGRYDNGGRTRDGSDRRKRGNTPPARRAKFPAPSDGDACWRFNEGICQNNDNNCKTRTGVRLRHICSARTGTNGDPCGKRHPAKYHS